MKTTSCKISALLLLVLTFSCGSIPQNPQNELSNFIKQYDFVPFKTPRASDGVGTLITFDNKAEAVVASLGDCFVPRVLNIEKFDSEISNYQYTISANDTVNFDTGRIFGNDTNLYSVFGRFNVKKIEVKFTDTFEERVTRISVERQLDSISSNDQLCLQKLTNNKNYFIERVLGANQLSIVFKDSLNSVIDIDAKLLKEIEVNSSFVKDVAGQSTLQFNEPRYIGYRAWQIDYESGFTGAKSNIYKIKPNEFIGLKTR